MNYSNEPASQPEPRPIPRARRRRARRTFFPKDAEGRAALLAVLARRAYPSYELFLYSLLCGAVIGLGYIFDSQAVLLLGVLFAPLMTPWVGLALATISGSLRLFFQTLVGLLISAALVFGTGAVSGLASRPFTDLTHNQAFIHSRLWWPELIVLAFGAILLTASFVRSEDKPFLPSVVVAYGFFMPLSAGGFGLGSSISELWPFGALVFVVHLAWATLFGLLTLAVLRFRPLTAGGYVFGLGVFAIFAFILYVLTMWGTPQASLPPSVPTASQEPLSFEQLPSKTMIAAVDTALPTATPSPLRPTSTEDSAETMSPIPLTLDITLPVTETRTITPSPAPTPIYAVVKAREGGGAYIRGEPGGKVVATLDNGAIVQILPDTQELNGTLWIPIIASINELKVEGWIIQSVLETATPVPNWEPSETPTPTP